MKTYTPSQGNCIGRILACAILCVFLLGSQSGADEAISSKGSTSSETGVGNLVADAIRLLAGADMAILPGSILRDAEIPIKDITAADIKKTITDPDQQVVVVQLSGAKLREALERSVSLAPKPSASFLQVSGITFRYDLNNSVGKRVGDILLGRRAIAPDADLKVAMPKELASGGLGYFRIWNQLKPDGASPGTLGSAVQNLLSGKIDAGTYLPNGRISRG
jgi:hypothetical protein